MILNTSLTGNSRLVRKGPKKKKEVNTENKAVQTSIKHVLVD